MRITWSSMPWDQHQVALWNPPTLTWAGWGGAEAAEQVGWGHRLIHQPRALRTERRELYLVLALLLDQPWGLPARAGWLRVSSSMKQGIFRASLLCRIPPQMPAQPRLVWMQRPG